MREEKIRKTGLNFIGDVLWGTHLCQFYQTKEDLINIVGLISKQDQKMLYSATSPSGWKSSYEN